ncbi:Crp/Fnr family transcriptional regulator [Rhodoferax aquaticus]|uniref:Crp/Fnr family transcriptional regulator n=1 Tax=Rhodoferax aquaticus TaxID=2527691 RepID=A0A515EME9_9BURK|nr:Crp/Fnr family transcriptional regulator [Rhodoferax aquaticus]QDL53828.1 Crp/Fnr family transcriptional regulator [Rhodoferax aquaticus]
MLVRSLTPPVFADLERYAAGAVLQRRGEAQQHAVYVVSGRVALGVLPTVRAANNPDVPASLEHQLGTVDGPAWLDASQALLSLPSAVDAVALGPVMLRRVALADFHATLASDGPPLRGVLGDLVNSHRQQLEMAVSRLAKDAEARCAEWLLRNASETAQGDCAVQLQLRKRAIAAQLGIAPETLSRALRHLRERRLISGSGRVLNLVDPPGLRRLAGL